MIRINLIKRFEITLYTILSGLKDCFKILKHQATPVIISEDLYVQYCTLKNKILLSYINLGILFQIFFGLNAKKRTIVEELRDEI